MCVLHLPEATQFDQLLETFGKCMPVQKWCRSTPENNGSTDEAIVTGKSAPLNVFQHTWKRTKRRAIMIGRLHLKCDGTRAETRFCLQPKWTSPFKSAGESVQLTTGSRGVHISGSNAGYTMF
jgi:hypothetical protein